MLRSQIRIEDPQEYQSIVDAEWDIIYEKLDQCVKSGAHIVLSKLPIGAWTCLLVATYTQTDAAFGFYLLVLFRPLFPGDLATQYFADRDVFCAGRVSDSDLTRVSRATGGRIQTTTHSLTDDVLGRCELFEERQVSGFFLEVVWWSLTLVSFSFRLALSVTTCSWAALRLRPPLWCSAAAPSNSLTRLSALFMVRMVPSFASCLLGLNARTQTPS